MPGIKGDPIVQLWTPAVSDNLPTRNPDEAFPPELTERIMAIDMLETDVGADELRIRFQNHDLSLFADERLAHQKRIGIQIGYPGDLSPLRYFYIVSASGIRELEVKCRGMEQLLHREIREDVFEDVTIAEVVEVIARRAKSFSLIQNTAAIRKIKYNKETDAMVLSRLAKDLGFVWWIELRPFAYFASGKAPFLTFAERNFRQKAFTTIDYLNDGRLVEEPEWQTDLVNVPGTVFSNIVDPFDGLFTDIITDIKALAKEASGTVSWSNVAALKARAQTTLNRLAVLEEDDSLYRKFHQTLAKMRLRMLGEAKWRARSTLNIQNMGTFVDGKYYVSEIRWYLAPGSAFEMDVTLLKNAFDWNAGRLHQAARNLRKILVNVAALQSSQLEERLLKSMRFVPAGGKAWGLQTLAPYVRSTPPLSDEERQRLFDQELGIRQGDSTGTEPPKSLLIEQEKAAQEQLRRDIEDLKNQSTQR